MVSSYRRSRNQNGRGADRVASARECPTVVDVRRFPGSRRNPQFNRDAFAGSLEAAGIRYRHEAALGGRLTDEPGYERFGCIRTAAFRSHAARMGRTNGSKLAAALEEPAPCFLCAETDWLRCHRRLIAELLAAHGFDVLHLRPEGVERHRPSDDAGVRGGDRLFLRGQPVG